MFATEGTEGVEAGFFGESAVLGSRSSDLYNISVISVGSVLKIA